MTPFLDAMRSTRAASLVSFNDPVRVGPETPIRDVVGGMRARRTGCALVCEGDRLVGIITDRDILRKIFPEGRWGAKAREVMTPDPATIREDDSLADVIVRMAKGGYRHLPLVDGNGRPLRVVSVRGLVRHLAEHFPVEVLNLPPHPDQALATPEGA
jgi:CBS domain-containing protein